MTNDTQQEFEQFRDWAKPFRFRSVNEQDGKPLTVKQEQCFQVMVKGLRQSEEGTGHHTTGWK